MKQLFHERALDMRAGYSQLGATCLVDYLPSHIQSALVEQLLIKYSAHMFPFFTHASI